MSKPYRLPSGKWLIKWLDENGKRRSETFASEAAARAALRRKQVHVDNVRSGREQPQTSTTVAEAYAEWIKTRPAARRQDDVSRFKLHILPHLGATPLPQVADAIAGFLVYLADKKTARHDVPGAKQKPLKPGTIKNVLRALSKFMADMKMPVRITYKVPETDYAWIQDEAHVARFVGACKPQWFQVAAALALYAGMRKGEIAGLARNKIDWRRKLITVAVSYDKPTKGKRLRHAPLSPQLEDILRTWLLEQPGDLVVTKVEVVDEKEMREAIGPKTKISGFARRAAKRAGVTSVNFHQLRHTAASHLALRVPLPMVGALLGHEDPKTTARYAHLDSESVAQDKRVHLAFRDDEAKVIKMPKPKER